MTLTRALALLMMTATAAVAAGAVGRSQDNPAVADEMQPLPLTVGDTLDPQDLHVITEPGLYGIGRELNGSLYGIAHGYLIRVEVGSLKIQSVLRMQDEILD